MASVNSFESATWTCIRIAHRPDHLDVEGVHLASLGVIQSSLIGPFWLPMVAYLCCCFHNPQQFREGDVLKGFSRRKTCRKLDAKFLRRYRAFVFDALASKNALHGREELLQFCRKLNIRQ